MATAEIVDRVIRRPEAVCLRLSLEEAVSLRLVLRRVGGSPSSSVRGFTDGISDALRGSNVPYDNDIEELTDRGRGDLSFSDGTDTVVREIARKWEAQA